MTPEQVSVITAISAILEKIGTMPIFSLIAIVVIGPWVAMFFVSRGQEKRFDAVAQMYKDNVKLVECYEAIARNLQDLVITNVQSMQDMKGKIDNNLFCPLIRKQTKQTEASS